MALAYHQRACYRPLGDVLQVGLAGTYTDGIMHMTSDEGMPVTLHTMGTAMLKHVTHETSVRWRDQHALHKRHHQLETHEWHPVHRA
eukprot:4568552-Amphidinium_carterae.2